MYFGIYTENGERATSGRTIDVDDKKSFVNNKRLYSIRMSSEEYDKVSENGTKSIYIVTSEATVSTDKDGNRDEGDMVKKRGRLINHEENHVLNDLNGETFEDVNAEHNDYYGGNCTDCKNSYSPDDKDVLTDPKYKNSKAYKNFKEIEKVVNVMIFVR